MVSRDRSSDLNLDNLGRGQVEKVRQGLGEIGFEGYVNEFGFCLGMMVIFCRGIFVGSLFEQIWILERMFWSIIQGRFVGKEDWKEGEQRRGYGSSLWEKERV